jgi:HEAT repeat protein
MNPYLELVDRLRIRAERYQAARSLSAGGRGARENRGKLLPPEKIEALIWGLSHESPVVRRCCLELLDQHPDPSAVPHIVGRLEDPVPRVRWHAVHALLCDACKPGHSFLTPDAATALRRVAEHDPNPKVRSYARWALSDGGTASRSAR